VLRLNAKVKPLRCASKLKLLRLYVWSENAYRRKLRRLYVESHGEFERRLAEARTASKGHDSADRERQVEEEVNTRREAAQQVRQQVDAERERERLEREQERQADESRQTFLAA
jgi:hypothetical protein